MLSRLRIAVPHFGHAESGVSDRPAGTRYTTTFRKDPIASPSRPAKMSSTRVRRSWSGRSRRGLNAAATVANWVTPYVVDAGVRNFGGAMFRKRVSYW